MSDDEIRFYNEEKLRFEELLNKFSWTEDCLLNEVCLWARDFYTKKCGSFLARNFNSMSD